MYKKIVFALLGCMTLIGLSHAANIQREFQPNYEINDAWTEILDKFVTIEAQSQVKQDIPTTVFRELNNLFTLVFPHLPQKTSYKVVYQQCTILSESLASAYDYNVFSDFMDKCHGELNRAIKEINTKYTIKPKIKAQPKAGSAPLTVTFDARESIDPSKDTIPTDNFFWYYKDVDGVDKIIGRGAVINHTFTEPGNYYVHLTVRSANKQSEGILDGEDTTNINVAPQAAVLVVYANGHKMDSVKHVKIGSKEAEKGVTFDGSATVAKGGRKIISHRWHISNGNNFSYKSEEKSGAPGSITAALTANGEYTVKLTTEDNESNEVEKEFVLKVSDPIAIIKQTPEKGDTTTEFRFDGAGSYAILSKIRLHTWEVYDEYGDKMFTTQNSEFNRKFDKPGPYRVKLIVTDELGQKDEESWTVYVDSAPPVAQFSMEPVADWEQASQYVFDASLSADQDVTNNNDALTYQRTFSNNESTQIEKSYDDGKKVIVSFNQPGIYKVKLTVTDSYGETNDVTKEVEVKSSLRPIIYTDKKAALWGESITFAVKTNKSIVNYIWDFGDGQTRSVQTNTIEHTYAKVGVFNVKLTATTARGEENTISTQIFIGEKNKPIVAYRVIDKNQNTMRQVATCSVPVDEEGGETVEVPAYKIDRYQEFTVDIFDSVNIKGTKDSLKAYYQPEDDEIYNRQNFSYKFMDLGCRYIDVTVEDTSAGKNDRQRVWFKVYNALPTLENITLGFPQYGNEVGVGFQQDQAKDILSHKYDPLVVKVEAIGSYDPDGFVSYYTWYYYDRNNPDRLLESRISPSTVPYTFFSLPTTIPGEYVFGVRMTDNDEGQIASEEIIGQSAAVPFFPDTKNLDIPMVTLIADKINIKAGEEVTFTTKAKILSQRKDFDAKKTIRYDFDGDGEFDLTTKDDVVKHMYTEPRLDGLVPRVEVVYRGYKGSAFGEKITIKNGLKPVLMYTLVDKTILLRDMSIGSISKKSVCFDRMRCKKDDTYIATQGNTFTFTYPAYGQYALEYTADDVYGNTATERLLIDVVEPGKPRTLEITSLPESVEIDGEHVIRVGKNLANSILLYARYNGPGDCFVDTDVTDDSDGDGEPDKDRDLECNEASYLIKYKPSFADTVGRVYYDSPIQNTSKTMTKNFVVQFLDFESVLDPEDKRKYDMVTDLIKDIDSTITGNQMLVNELIALRNNIQSEIDVANGVVMINDILEKDSGLAISEQQRKNITAVLEELSDGSLIAALGGDEYKQAKQEILFILPENLRVDVENLFKKIEAIDNPQNQKEQIKTLLDNIVQTIITNGTTSLEGQGENQVLQEDIDLVVMPNVCRILNYFEIASERCSAVETETDTGGELVEATSSGFGSVLKWVLIILGIGGLIFVGIVVFFAIKAKQEENEGEEEGEG